MEGVIFAIYTISMISAFVCLWVKWHQDQEKNRIDSLERKIIELQKQVGAFEQKVKKNAKDSFPFVN